MEISGYSPKDERWSQLVNCKKCKLPLTVTRADLFVCKERDISGRHDDVSVQCPSCQKTITLACYGDQRGEGTYIDVYGILPTRKEFLENEKKKAGGENVSPRVYFSKGHLSALQKALADANIPTTDFIVLVAALEQYADIQS